MKPKITNNEIKNKISEKLLHRFSVSKTDATDAQLYSACALVLKELMADMRSEFMRHCEKNDKKHVNYICMEFLMGRSLKTALYNLGLTDSFSAALKDFSAKIEDIYELEPDAGLGNGGLGRLAACFLDGLASKGTPAFGYSIKYEYGIFRQKLIDGWQTELPDNWLPGGIVWLEEHPEDSVEVKFSGRLSENWDGPYHQINHTGYISVLAVPFDLLVPGYDGKGISLLRLWSAKSPGLDMKLFNEGEYMKAMEQNAMAEVISKVLYPSDNHIEGKSLRLKQQYFMVCASISDIARRHLNKYGTLMNLPHKAAIHINDTHPALVIPELMRILLDECGYTWDDSFDIVTKTVAYTNHTVMREALECWPADLFQSLLPRIYQIIQEIDNRFRKMIWEKTNSVDFVERTAIISGGLIKMANLSIIGGHSVNGVSELHSELLKETVFEDFYKIFPGKFTNVTNGIAHRRWLCQSNTGLTALLCDTIGNEYIKIAAKLSDFKKHENNKNVLEKLHKIKHENKIKLCEYIRKTSGITVNPDSIFDVQAKRLHEYKRQHLNVLNILSEYFYIKENKNADFTPKTYFFAAKAAPGYYLAKEIIKFICDIAKMIENAPDVNDKLQVVYLEDYNVSMAEILMPAADISQQISLAGTEASGTGNMKLMINGAVTIGTEDGANVEIHRAVGDENIIIFGMNTDEVIKRKQAYRPSDIYNNNEEIKKILNYINDQKSPVYNNAVANSLLNSDPYMVLADFEDYKKAMQKSSELYKTPDVWAKMALNNIAMAGVFAADRAIDDYCKDIWKT